jgi:hypothetical protein
MFFTDILRFWLPEDSSVPTAAFTLIRQLILDFLRFAAMVVLAAKSLLMLREQGAGVESLRELLSKKIVKLVKIWLVVELIIILPPYLISLITLIYDTHHISDNMVLIILLVIVFFSLLWIAVMLTAQIILAYLICHVIDINGNDVVRDSLSMAKRTLGKLFKIFLSLIAFYALMIFAGTISVIFFNITGVLTSAAMFFQIIFMTVLYADSPRPVVSNDEYTGEEFDPDLLEEIAAAEDIGDSFRYRVEPSLDFADVGEFHCGLARVRCSYMGKWGYADIDGQIVIPFAYKEAGDFHEGIAVVKEGRDEYYINTEGERVINPEGYDQASRFQDGLAVVKIGFDWGVIDCEGVFRELPYDDVYSFSEGFAVVLDGKKWSYINRDLKSVFSTEYDDVWSFYNGLAMVEKNGKLGYIDMTGTLVIPLRYANALPFSEGLAAVMAVAGGKWGYIDRNGHEIVPAAFDRAGSFQQGRAVVCADVKYGHIDTEGAFITPLEYYAAGAFNDGFAPVGDTAFGYVNMNGRECASLVYQEARPFSENFAWVKIDDLWGILEAHYLKVI